MPLPSSRISNSVRCRPGFITSLLSACLLLTLSQAVSFAQYRFDHLTTEDGLPHNSIGAILQTRDGYLWLATIDGLARYNGAQFVVFNRANVPAIKGNRFTTLFEDGEGTLWIGTADAGLISYRNGEFKSYTEADGLVHNWVRAIRNDSENNLLVLTGGGLVRREGERFVAHARYDSTLNYSWVRADSSGGLWSGDKNGLHRHSPEGVKTYRLPGVQTEYHVLSLYEDRRGQVWIDMGRFGIVRIKNDEASLFAAQKELTPQRITSIYMDRQETLWIAYRGGQLCRSREGEAQTCADLPELVGNGVTAIYQDREGSLWMAIGNNGLFRLKRKTVTVYTARDGLSSRNVYPIYEDRAGNVWIGAWHGLNKFRDGRITNYTPELKPSHYLSFTSLFEDREGNFWAGTFGGGLKQFKDGKFLPHPLVAPAGTAESVVWAIQQDHEGNLWTGGPEGLTRYRAGATELFTTHQGLPHNDVRVIIRGHDRSLWIGTYGGVARLRNGAFETYTERDGLASNQVRSLYEDEDGVLWIGTYDGGLSRLHDGKFTNYTTRHGLFDHGVFQILEDARGQFWMSCNRGIYRVSRRELNDFAAGSRSSITSVAYGKADGLLNPECNGGSQPAGWKTRDGRLWFPTQDGVAVIDPNQVEINEWPPPVLIEEARLGSNPLAFSDVVEIPAGQDNLEFHYAGLSFINPEKMKFKYKLEGLDNDWVEAGNRRTAYFAHLPPGEYTFRVVAANSDGVWNSVGAQIRVIVRPPFWRTWWFLLICAALLCGGLAFAYRRRISKLKRAHAAQEAFSRQLIASQESERKRIAAELHDGLGQNLLIIKNRALLGLKGNGDTEQAKRQLMEISDTSSQAIEEVREIAYALRPFQLDRLGLTKAIEAILKQVSASSEIEFTSRIDPVDNLFSKESEINLYRIVQESVNNIVKHSGASRARVEIERDARGVLISIRDNGHGFALDETASHKSRGDGLGLAGISERARILGGKHTIQTSVGEGTTVTIKIGIKGEPDGE